MPQLLRHTNAGWAVTEEADVAWLTLEDWQAGQPLLVSVDSEPDSSWLQASAIAIEFPALTDGRGLSLAVLLRTRLRYEGDLVARGGVHEDIAHFLARCGFDVIELPPGKDPHLALAWISPHSGYYQPSVSNSEPRFKGPDGLPA